MGMTGGTMSSETYHDDAWLAVQYVLGELPAEASVAFEARLADEVSLCQRVADASLLVATTKAAAPVCAPLPVAVPRHRRAAVAAVAAAAVCTMLTLLPRDERPAAPGESRTAAKLLSLWRGHGDALSSDADFDGVVDHAEWSNDQVPSWMIAAVSLERRQRAPGENATPGQTDEEWEDN